MSDRIERGAIERDHDLRGENSRLFRDDFRGNDEEPEPKPSIHSKLGCRDRMCGATDCSTCFPMNWQDDSKQEDCEICNGHGVIGPAQSDDCEACNGTGFRQ